MVELIKKFNALDGKLVGKSDLQALLIQVKRAQPHPALTRVAQRLNAAISRMNGHKVKLTVKPEPIPTDKKKPAAPRVAKGNSLRGRGGISAKSKPTPVSKSSASTSMYADKKVQSDSAVTSSPAKPARSTKSALAGLGYASADRVPTASVKTFQLPGPVGAFLGNLQPYKLSIIIPGETHSGKSELGKQIADAFIDGGFEVAYVDWEQGGMTSKDTAASVARNIKPQNRGHLYVIDNLPRTLDALKELARTAKVIVLDSSTKLKGQANNNWIDELRETHPDVIWIHLMQQTKDGGTRGGNTADYDSPVVIRTFRQDHRDPLKNYAVMEKNRGNKTGIYYNMAGRRVADDIAGLYTSAPTTPGMGSIATAPQQEQPIGKPIRIRL